MKNKTDWKILVILVVFVMVGSCAAISSARDVSESDRTSSSATIYVPDNYSTIQEAVDAATPGDTIIVRDGAYIENIEVDKRLTFRSENGYDSTIVQAEDPGDHVFNVSADYVEISGFTVKGATGWLAAGIYLYYADYCNISNNICSNNDWGIYLEYSSNNSISGNDVINNDWGIYLEYSSNNSISGNDVINNNYYGSHLEYSSNNSISGNTFVNDGLFVSKSSYHNTIEGNTVNNKPLVYLEDASDYKIEDAGQVILINCRNITVENLDLSNTYVGIELWVTVDSIIADNTVSNNWRGIYLGDSSNNSISGNNVSDNNVNGIYLRYSNNNTISGNDVNNNDDGISLGDSSNNSISGNDVNNNDDGISLYDSRNNSISGNNVSSNNDDGISLGDSSNNSISGNDVNNNDDGISLYDSRNNSISGNNVNSNYYGISLGDSSNNTISGNTFVNDGLFVSKSSYHNTVEGNTVNNKPLVYLEGASDYKVKDAGQVILVNCRNITVENLDLSNTCVGIELWVTVDSIIADNTVSKNWRGIYLGDSSNNSISGNNVSDNNVNGIYLWDSSNNSISGNNVSSNNDDGIYLDDSRNNSISGNNVSSNNWDGIYLDDSRNNTISGNDVTNNDDGIYLDDSRNNTISGNDVNNNDDGIYLDDSSNNTISGNTFVNDGLFVSKSSYHNTVEGNTVNNKPLVYLEGASDYKVKDAGQIILVNCRNITVENLDLSNTRVGIEVAFSSFITIKNNNCSNNKYDGIYLPYSNSNNISNNNCSNNQYGIHLYDSNNNHLSNNNCSDNKDGIYLRHSNNNSISNNNCSSNKWRYIFGGDGIHLYESNSNNISGNSCSFNNWDGIKLDDSNNNHLSNNHCSNNKDGIALEDSTNNKLNGNIMLENGIVIWGDSLSDYTHEIDESNTVNEKSVYYRKDIDGGRIPDGAGQVILVNCTNISIENQNLNNASVGIQIAFSSYITIKNNNCSNNGDGIRLYESNNNSISNNNCSSNNRGGIRFYKSNNNLIHPNNFINNTDNVYSYGSTNLWNSKEKISYTYNETTYTNYLGNYWSDYNGTDTDKDGIGDTPYVINSDKDNYPLMKPFENYFPEENETNKNKNQKLAFSSYYQPINILVNPRVPPYPLPLNLSSITNIGNITAEFGLTEREKELLRTNGFVIIAYGNEDEIVAPYKDMKEMGIPIFVTSDTLLHLYHIQFNEILKGIEEREFFDVLVEMSNAMLDKSIQDYETFEDADLKEPARRNVAYFAVALKLLQTPTEGYNGSEDLKVINFSIPEYVTEDVNNELENITQHEGFSPSCIFNSDTNRDCEDECCYCEDYSQYVPRGHYTRSEKLKRYFKAMMWYGRMAFLLKGGNVSECSEIETPLLTEADAKIATCQASLLSAELPAVKVGNTTAQEIWDRIYSVTAFFVGTADDLTPYEYQDAITNVFGTEFNASDLSDENKLLELKVELAKLRSPEIYGGSGVCVIYPPITKEKLYECLNKTKGMRFMGRRFVPDSYMFQQLVSPAVGMYIGNGMPFTMCITGAGPARCLPRGLDIMSVLGSERAGDILIEEGDTGYAGLNTSYEKQLNELQSKFTAFNTSDWNRNLYWSWLYTLKPLLTEFGDGYPTFMQTMAWQNKALQTALASWTELRHDTILYAKQSYTPVFKGMPPKPKLGYVEPVPEFYARLLALTEMTENGLVDLDVLNETEKDRLHNLGLILERLMNISVAELENEALTDYDYEFIMDFGANLDSLVSGVNAKGKETTIVADVHTDCNTEMVLEEGVGYVDLILVAYIVPDGRIILGAGPVLSYYEFKQPMDDRLTDEKWKEMLESEPPERPGWVDGIGG